MLVFFNSNEDLQNLENLYINRPGLIRQPVLNSDKYKICTEFKEKEEICKLEICVVRNFAKEICFLIDR